MRAPRVLPSPADGVSLWLVELVRDTVELETLASYLGPAERLRAARFGTPQLRDRWIAGRGSLRIILGQALGVAPVSVEIARGRRGRPQLANAPASPDFNVSHTAGVALVAVGRSLGVSERVGVDIERADRAVNADRLGRKFLTADERTDDAALDADARRRAFLRRWTCKEAMSKATGDALSAPMGRIAVDIGRYPRAGAADRLHVLAGPPPYEPADWQLYAIDAGDDLLATLALWRGPSSIDAPSPPRQAA